MGGAVLGQFQHAINGIKVRGTPEQIRAFATLPGVVEVKPVRTYHVVNAESVPFIGAPQAWQGPPGLHGEHIRIAVIDTGVDYTHANFGGPGTVAAWKAAFATSTQPPDPTLFGPDAPKVKGGTDLVGDAYNANNPSSVPMPDPNPLDGFGHGSDTSGARHAVEAGIVAGAPPGKAGTIPHVVGNPSTGEQAIGVAAMDSHASLLGETLALAPTGGITALDANGIAAADGTSLPVVILPDIKGTGSGGISLGCDPAEYTAAGVTGKLAVTIRGGCARVARALFGPQAGAAAVALINNAPGYPPYEGPINSNPDTGMAYTVTIPFLGVQGPATNTD